MPRSANRVSICSTSSTVSDRAGRVPAADYLVSEIIEVNGGRLMS